MRVIAAVLLLVELAHARPQGPSSLTDSASAYITKYDSNNNELGEYSYDVYSSDGQFRGETRRVINPGTPQETSVVEGYYSYIAPDGERKTVGYRANENGFRPEGEHLTPAASIRRRRPGGGIPSSVISSLAEGGLGR